MDTSKLSEPATTSALTGASFEATLEGERTAPGQPEIQAVVEIGSPSGPVTTSASDRLLEEAAPAEHLGGQQVQSPALVPTDGEQPAVDGPISSISSGETVVPAPASPSSKEDLASSPVRAAPPQNQRPAPEITLRAEDPVGSREPLRPTETDHPRASRFALLAACVGFSACLGAAGGATGVLALGHMLAPPHAPTAAQVQPVDDVRPDIRSLKESVAQLRTHLKTVGESVTALRSSINGSTSATAGQLGRIAEVLDKVDRAETERGQAQRALIEQAQAERAQAEKLQAERAQAERAQAERLQAERHAAAATAAPAAAGSSATAAPNSAAPARPAAAVEATGGITPPAQAKPSAPAAQAKPGPTVVEGWILRRVRDGAALVEGRYGIIEVEPGDSLPGVGRIQDIRREDGRWVVVTSKGLIQSLR